MLIKLTPHFTIKKYKLPLKKKKRGGGRGGVALLCWILAVKSLLPEHSFCYILYVVLPISLEKKEFSITLLCKHSLFFFNASVS